jgi:valyl-tRNA synthetase
MPYLTEELWQKLPIQHSGLLHRAYTGAEATIMLAAYPEGERPLIDDRTESEMAAVIDLISRVRNIRSEMNIKPGERVRVMIAANESLRNIFTSSSDQIARLSRASEVAINSRLDGGKACARAVLAGGAELAIPLEGLIDFAQESVRLSKEKEKLQKESAKLEAQLSNADFTARAPAEKVQELRARVGDIAQRLKALDQMLEALR